MRITTGQIISSALIYLLIGAQINPAIAQTSKAASSPSNANASTPGKSSDLQQALEQTQKLLKEQAETLQSLRQVVEKQGKEIDSLRTERVDNAAASAAKLQSAVKDLAPAKETVVITNKPAASSTGKDQPAELSFRLGYVKFTPGGWVDLTTYYRSTDVGTGMGTNFQNIPLKNSVQGGSSEVRLSAQASRFFIRAEEKIRNTKIFGYAEMDFNGYLPSNAFVTSNNNTFRMRAYYVNVGYKKWDFLGGQMWSLITPERRVTSPYLADLFNTFHIDNNYHIGLTYARQGQARVVYHATPNLAFSASMENPEQYSGSAVTFPSLFSTTETDINSGTNAGGGTATPNRHPDFLARVSYDHKVRGQLWHVGAAGLLTASRIYTPASVTKNTDFMDSREGGGVAGNINLGLFKGFRLISSAYWSDGGGRYIGGAGPGFIALQPGTATSPFRAALIHSGSGMGGFEWDATKKTTISAYYGGAYFQRRYGIDPSVKALTYVGYGYPGSPNTQNRAIQEGSFATTTSLWKAANFGALQLVTQTSYVTRSPWYVAPGTPKNAHLIMSYASIRFIMP